MPETGRAEPTPPETPTEDGDLFGYLSATAIALFVLSTAATLFSRRRGATSTAIPIGADAPRPTPPAGPDLARAAELGLAEVGDRSRDPREAIIACYAAMERELEKSPGTSPQDFGHPLGGAGPGRRAPRPACRQRGELVDLFEEARFSPHVMNEGHRADAVRTLRLVQHELQGAP